MATSSSRTIRPKRRADQTEAVNIQTDITSHAPIFGYAGDAFPQLLLQQRP